MSQFVSKMKVTEWAAEKLFYASVLLERGLIVEVRFVSARTGHQVTSESLGTLGDLLPCDPSRTMDHELLSSVTRGRAYLRRGREGSWGVEVGMDGRSRFWVVEQSEGVEKQATSI